MFGSFGFGRSTSQPGFGRPTSQSGFLGATSSSSQEGGSQMGGGLLRDGYVSDLGRQVSVMKHSGERETYRDIFVVARYFAG